ncbi:helix-turn-helix domain-containing protein, partial [Pseudomonas sp. HY7a-MNA-CIBAN-0227]
MARALGMHRRTLQRKLQKQEVLAIPAADHPEYAALDENVDRHSSF